MGPVRELSELDDEELRLLLNDDRLPLSEQLEVIDERRRRAALRRREEELAELVASSAALGELDEAARLVADAQARLDEARRFRHICAQAAFDEGHTLGAVAEVARVARSTAMRLRDEPPGPPAPQRSPRRSPRPAL
ncbi:MAG: hypothetical protein OXT07_15475 [bacterium]|nr:hypothetical protein [bacterium]